MKLAGPKLFKKFPAFYGTLNFITAFTSVRGQSGSWARGIHSMSSYPTFWSWILIFSSHQCPDLQSGLFTYFDVFSTVHHSIELFHQPTLMHNFLYSLTICLLHYYPRHVSSINTPIFRRKNCIHTASGIFSLCKRLYSTLVECVLNVNE